jgi:hypothetical protein
MEWMTALYGYMVEVEMRKRRRPIPEELEYVEMLRA